MEKFGKRIKNLRISRDMSENDLAEKLGKTGPSKKQYIYDLEAGRIKRIDLELLTKLSEIFKVPIRHFMGEEEENENVFVSATGNNEEYWKGKYMECLNENSKLKSKIIELMEVISGMKKEETNRVLG